MKIWNYKIEIKKIQNYYLNCRNYDIINWIDDLKSWNYDNRNWQKVKIITYIVEIVTLNWNYDLTIWNYHNRNYDIIDEIDMLNRNSDSSRNYEKKLKLRH